MRGALLLSMWVGCSASDPPKSDAADADADADADSDADADTDTDTDTDTDPPVVEDGDGDGVPTASDCDDADPEVLAVAAVDGAPYPTLGEALAAATEGATVSVCATTHEGPFVATVAVHLESDGAVLTGGGDRVLALPGGSSIRGFTLREGVVDGPGGALLLTSPGTLDVEDCELTENRARAGGAVALAAGSVATITASTVSRNVASSVGGGISLEGGTLDLAGSVVSDNEARDFGGGIYVLDGAVTGGEVSGNRLTGQPFWSGSTGGDYVTPSLSGGGIGGTGTMTVTGTVITGNQADFGGGVGVLDGTLTLGGVRIEGNGVPFGDGGGLQCWNSTCTLDAATTVVANGGDTGAGLTVGFGSLTGGVVTGNTATLYGGGVRLEEGTLTDTVVTDNVAPLAGGVSVLYETGIVRCAITGNSADVGGGVGTTYRFGVYGLTIEDSTIAANSAATDGGGVYAEWDVVLRRTTIVDNVADRGAGLFVDGAAAGMEEGSFARNVAATGGGAVWIQDGSAAFGGTDFSVGADDNLPGDVFAGGAEHPFGAATTVTCDAGGCAP